MINARVRLAKDLVLTGPVCLFLSMPEKLVLAALQQANSTDTYHPRSCTRSALWVLKSFTAVPAQADGSG